MKRIRKIGLAVLRGGKLLLVRNKNTSKYIMPGGRIEKNESDIETLRREILEELTYKINGDEVKYVGEYEDIASNDADSIVNIKLYIGDIIGEFFPSNEIEEFVWFNPNMDNWELLSDIIKNKIIPDLIKKKYL